MYGVIIQINDLARQIDSNDDKTATLRRALCQVPILTSRELDKQKYQQDKDKAILTKWNKLVRKYHHQQPVTKK